MVQSNQSKCCELLTLSLKNLQQMESEFLPVYDSLLTRAQVRLRRALKVKDSAINYCKEFIEELKQEQASKNNKSSSSIFESSM